MTNIINKDTVPFLFVYLNTSVTNVTGNGTGYVIKFDTVLYGSGYNAGTGVYTVPVTGRYMMSTSFLLSNITSSANANLSVISMGSVGVRMSEFAMTAAKDPSLRFCTNGALAVNCNAGDSIFVTAQLNNGTGAVVGITGGTSPYTAWMAIKYLG